MAKRKLQRFAEMQTFDNIFQIAIEELKEKGFAQKGKWSEIFGNKNPIVLELGCGKGEYTIGLATKFPDKNFIGIDIKGARLWTGCKQAIDANLKNVHFIRTKIEFLNCFFTNEEVNEIWLTFPDPQRKKSIKRLSSSRFLNQYNEILAENGIIHLKTDSKLLYEYTKALIEENELDVLVSTNDLYNSHLADNILSIQTFYEKKYIEQGIKITYQKFILSKNTEIKEPKDEFVELIGPAIKKRTNISKSL